MLGKDDYEELRQSLKELYTKESLKQVLENFKFYKIDEYFMIFVQKPSKSYYFQLFFQK